MKIPSLVEFYGDTSSVLRSDLLASKPNEGCSLLIGDHKPSSDKNALVIFRIAFIWPCCNIWETQSDEFTQNLKESSQCFFTNASKRNRFLVDPREQIHAQKWARDKNMYVLGSAHLHFNGPLIPSRIDQKMAFSEGLMIIMNSSLELRVWWLKPNEDFSPIEVAYLTG